MHENSRLLFKEYAQQYFKSGMSVLEIGARIPSEYQLMVNDPSINWKYADINVQGLSSGNDEWKLTESLDYIMPDEYSIPCEDGEFDIVVSGQVLEHVRKVWVWIREVSRVVKPGGLVITINPVSWPYHEAPVDCWRVYPEGMRALYDEGCLEVLLSKAESLEKMEAKRKFGGVGKDYQNYSLKRRILNSLLFKIGFPEECSIDSITVGRKLRQPYIGK